MHVYTLDMHGSLLMFAPLKCSLFHSSQFSSPRARKSESEMTTEIISLAQELPNLRAKSVLSPIMNAEIASWVQTWTPKSVLSFIMSAELSSWVQTWTAKSVLSPIRSAEITSSVQKCLPKWQFGLKCGPQYSRNVYPDVTLGSSVGLNTQEVC